MGGRTSETCGNELNGGLNGGAWRERKKIQKGNQGGILLRFWKGINVKGAIGRSIGRSKKKLHEILEKWWISTLGVPPSASRWRTEEVRWTREGKLHCIRGEAEGGSGGVERGQE